MQTLSHKGADCFMKMLFSVFLAFSFLGIGIAGVLKQKNYTRSLEEAVRFIGFVKTELHYRRSDFISIFESGCEKGYKNIHFENQQIRLDKTAGGINVKEFSDFVECIGTTDESGQFALCDEYSARFGERLKNQLKKESEKIQVNTALSVLGALCVLILFL